MVASRNVESFKFARQPGKLISALIAATVVTSNGCYFESDSNVQSPVPSTKSFQFEEATILDIHAAFKSGDLTCHDLTASYLARIAAYDKQGPNLRALLTINDKALAEADNLDSLYGKAGPVGSLHCIPVILKDNYNTADMPTTDGSASMDGMQPTSDAFVVNKLRAAGALILAKANMHEFALSGTTVSSLGGQTLNPYDLRRL